jgi:hypothetical protein
MEPAMVPIGSGDGGGGHVPDSSLHFLQEHESAVDRTRSAEHVIMQALQVDCPALS